MAKPKLDLDYLNDLSFDERIIFDDVLNPKNLINALNGKCFSIYQLADAMGIDYVHPAEASFIISNPKEAPYFGRMPEQYKNLTRLVDDLVGRWIIKPAKDTTPGDNIHARRYYLPDQEYVLVPPLQKSFRA